MKKMFLLTLLIFQHSLMATSETTTFDHSLGLFLADIKVHQFIDAAARNRSGMPFISSSETIPSPMGDFVCLTVEAAQGDLIRRIGVISGFVNIAYLCGRGGVLREISHVKLSEMDSDNRWPTCQDLLKRD